MTIEKIARIHSALKEITTAMRRYEADADGDSPYMHRDMMHRVDEAIALGDALLPLLSDSASYRAGAEDMRERMLEKTQISIDYFEMAPGAMPAKEAAACSIALKDLRQAIRSLPLPDLQPTPTQESRDV